jgi:hypothetical protein
VAPGVVDVINPFEHKVDISRLNSLLLNGIEPDTDCLMNTPMQNDNRDSILDAVDRSKTCCLSKRNGIVRRLVWF